MGMSPTPLGGGTEVGGFDCGGRYKEGAALSPSCIMSKTFGAGRLPEREKEIFGRSAGSFVAAVGEGRDRKSVV